MKVKEGVGQLVPGPSAPHHVPGPGHAGPAGRKGLAWPVRDNTFSTRQFMPVHASPWIHQSLAPLVIATLVHAPLVRAQQVLAPQDPQKAPSRLASADHIVTIQAVSEI